MSLHSTLVCQLAIIEHKIDRHGSHTWKRQRLFAKPRWWWWRWWNKNWVYICVLLWRAELVVERGRTDKEAWRFYDDARGSAREDHDAGAAVPGTTCTGSLRLGADQVPLRWRGGSHGPHHAADGVATFEAARVAFLSTVSLQRLRGIQPQYAHLGSRLLRLLHTRNFYFESKQAFEREFQNRMCSVLQNKTFVSDLFWKRTVHTRNFIAKETYENLQCEKALVG